VSDLAAAGSAFCSAYLKLARNLRLSARDRILSGLAVGWAGCAQADRWLD